jgi:putative oxidoreductase
MTLALLLIRIVVGFIFIAHGTQKLYGAFGGGGIVGTGKFLESLNFRPGERYAKIGGTVEMSAGILLILGLFIPLASTLIIAMMLSAALTAHSGKGFWVNDGGPEYPFVLITIATALAISGPGRVSLDRLLEDGGLMQISGLIWALAAIVIALMATSTVLALRAEPYITEYEQKRAA